MDDDDLFTLQMYAIYVAGEWHSAHRLPIPDGLEDLVNERVVDASTRFLHGQQQLDESSVFHQLARKVYQQGLRLARLQDTTNYAAAAGMIQTIGDYRADGKLLETIYEQYEDLDEILKGPDEEILEDETLALCASYVVEDNGQFYRAAKLLEDNEDYVTRVNACNILGDLWCRP